MDSYLQQNSLWVGISNFKWFIWWFMQYPIMELLIFKTNKYGITWKEYEHKYGRRGIKGEVTLSGLLIWEWHRSKMNTYVWKIACTHPSSWSRVRKFTCELWQVLDSKKRARRYSLYWSCGKLQAMYAYLSVPFRYWPEWLTFYSGDLAGTKWPSFRTGQYRPVSIKTGSYQSIPPSPDQNTGSYGFKLRVTHFHTRYI